MNCMYVMYVCNVWWVCDVCYVRVMYVFVYARPVIRVCVCKLCMYVCAHVCYLCMYVCNVMHEWYGMCGFFHVWMLCYDMYVCCDVVSIVWYVNVRLCYVCRLCMYVCMLSCVVYVCILCLYVTYVCMYASMYVCMLCMLWYVCMACTYVLCVCVLGMNEWINVMYVCYVCIYVKYTAYECKSCIIYYVCMRCM